ncbi:hypothetical protein SAMN04489712_10450 [Thermomonospora echinospora]|uniref:Uncharacterized protein n=2 Tax=Thermomonospora echinospora TaxID=1992 RepID=A0A1H5YL05_9ACTN|nr:hypothetical protein SAMN04489712_10450 [Thermomonospora echinospora]
MDEDETAGRRRIRANPEAATTFRRTVNLIG